MNILMATGTPTYATEGQVDIYLQVATNTGLMVENTVSINFANSAVQTNNALIQAGKDMLLSRAGYTVLATDNTKLIGGAV